RYQNLGNLYPLFSTGLIRRVSQHLILLMLFFVPPHQFTIGFISEKALQTWYYWEIPHHLSGNFFLDGLPVDLTRINFELSNNIILLVFISFKLAHNIMKYKSYFLRI